jgi:putative flippase GtrA
VLCGTAAGLIVKYILDKRYIFNFTTHSLEHNTKIFALYSTMGILTTAIFWAFEFIFHLIFNESATLRYLGGAVGLAIGYFIKYQLDKNLVFKEFQ